MMVEILYGPVFRFTLALLLFVSFNGAQEECKHTGCYPSTGDLLVGRSSQLTATSTCGTQGQSKYCIISYLKRNKKCFYCNSAYDVDIKNPQFSHLPKYMVTEDPKKRLDTWWQAENGKQEVTIQLDLKTEFVFTHLIMTFKTFRPKAMYIERSWNYKADWSVYRYFAHDCAKSFPNIPRGPQKNIDDVICTERYSAVEPSTEGEVVMKVLDPLIQQREDPYSVKVQNLLKLTNLRIVFTELHTFGDDVLGDTPEINQKYYYSLYEMVVRGSCSCYGHAEHCIPSEGTATNTNMVYGKCNCTHNTTGSNCHLCKPGYDDQPWRPAYRDKLNGCKKCNCNGHTELCHFDPAVYNATGGESGGVCDECRHNTAGRQCEQCKPLYFRDPFKNIFDPNVCKPCDCDPSGSFGGGECETITDPEKKGRVAGQVGTVAGRCICKKNVEGRRCDTCRDGFWNLLESNTIGCIDCNCDKRGTVDKNTCDQKTGTCRCKRFVEGFKCSKCLDRFWSLGSTQEGCKSCGCDPGGALTQTCDDVSGTCRCRPNLIGRQCDKVRPGYFSSNLDFTKFEGENSIPGLGTPFSILRKIAVAGTDTTWTGDGYIQVQKGSNIDFTMVRVPYTGQYNIVVRYDTQTSGDWSDVQITVFKADGGKLDGAGCAHNDATKAFMYPILPANKNAVVIDPSVCLEKGVRYNVKIDFRSNNGHGNGQTLIDSIVLLPKVTDLALFQGREGNQNKQLYESYNCKQYYIKGHKADNAPEVCRNLQFSISAIMNNGALACDCDPVGTKSSGSSEILTCKTAGGQCPCKAGVVGRRCDRCAAGYFGFGAEGCTACDCSLTGSISQFCHDSTGQCTCLPKLEGRKCDLCPVNHYGFPNCKPCQCSGHSLTCDPHSGKCTNCKHNTAGPKCDKCAKGYYGDATKGTEGDCQQCQCPGGSSQNQFSNTCELLQDGRVICNNCSEGYRGYQCEKCGDGYFGNPLKPGGSCEKCNCNGNIGQFAVGKCDAVTGICYNCLNNAAGNHCEKCKPGYFGNASNQTCRACVCNKLGSDATKKGVCDPLTGQCTCLKNVDGIQCDKCILGFYNLASGKGCEECMCDKKGSLEGSCNQLDGQCRCRVGFGGRSCNECEDYSWGDPKAKTCKPCACNPVGSKDLQCNRTTGVCECLGNIVGDKCNMCAARTTGLMPKCEDCHTCNDEWDDIVTSLEKNITNLIKLKGNFTFNASEIALYTKEIQNLKLQLQIIETMFGKRTVEEKVVDIMRKKVDGFRMQLMDLDQIADKYVVAVENTTVRNKEANIELDNLHIRFKTLNKNANEFKTNVTKIIESNIGGALNSTRDSLQRSRAAQEVVDAASKKTKESKRIRKKIMKEIVKGDPTFDNLDKENNELVDNLAKRVDDLEDRLKELNGMLCGSSSECGGCTVSGCETCGAAGSSNCTGIKQLASTALRKANEAKETLLRKRANAKEILNDVKMAEIAVNASLDVTKLAEVSSNTAKKIGEAALGNITALIKDITAFLNEAYNHPNKSKILALETLALNISLTPKEVKALAEKIREAVRNLTNVDAILRESQKDYDLAVYLKSEALAAKKFALRVMNKTQTVLNTLEKALQLQNSTGNMIKMVRLDLSELLKIIEQIKVKANIIDSDLKTASNDTAKLETKRDMIAKMFKDNRDKLNEAEKKSVEATNLAKKVNEKSVEVKDMYNVTKGKLDEKLNITQQVHKRIKALSDGAIKLFQTSALKLQQLNDLKLKYKLNEDRVKDLLNQLYILEVKLKFIRQKMQAINNCHSCNPLLPRTGDSFCVMQRLLDEEKREVDAAIASAAASASSNTR